MARQSPSKARQKSPPTARSKHSNGTPGRVRSEPIDQRPGNDAPATAVSSAQRQRRPNSEPAQTDRRLVVNRERRDDEIEGEIILRVNDARGYVWDTLRHLADSLRQNVEGESTEPQQFAVYPRPLTDPSTDASEYLYRRTSNFYHREPLLFDNQDEAQLEAIGPYKGPVPVLRLRLNAADPKPLPRVKGIGRPQNTSYEDLVMRAHDGRDPLGISCVLAPEFDWDRIASTARGCAAHRFRGDKIKNPKKRLARIAREVIEAADQVHPDLSLESRRGLAQSWQLFRHLGEVCCRLIEYLTEVALAERDSPLSPQEAVRIIIDGPDSRPDRTSVRVDGRNVSLTAKQLATLLRLVLGAGKSKNGWVASGRFISEELTTEPRKDISRLRDSLGESADLIQTSMNRSGEYRLTVQLADVHYNLTYLLSHDDQKVRGIAEQLRVARR